MTWFNNGGEEIEVEVELEVEKEIEVEYDFKYEAEVDKEFDAEVDICVDVDVEDNSATFAIDVEAFGDDSATELDLSVLVTDESSSIIAVGFAAVD